MFLVDVDFIFICFEMKSNIHDDCQKTFKEIKFDKNHRFVTYKVDNESVVSSHLSRLSKQSVPGKIIGPSF